MNVKRELGTVLLLLTTVGASGRQAALQAPSASASATIRGSVVSAPSMKPLSGARVSISLAGAEPTTSDSQGRFTFREVPPGRYNVFATADDYMIGADGWLSRLTIPPSETSVDVSLVLTPFASISGTVRDPNGGALPSVMVQAMRRTYRDGRPEMVDSNSPAATDANGRYRISQLTPGDFYLRATPLRSPREASLEGSVVTYFPSAMDPAAATVVHIPPGVDPIVRDITLQQKRVYNISGVLDFQLPETELLALPNRSAFSFWVVRINSAVSERPILIENARKQSQDRTPETFELRGLPPGTYDLYPVVLSGTNELSTSSDVSHPVWHTGRTRATIVDHDVNDVRVKVQHGQSVEIRMVTPIRAAGEPEPAPWIFRTISLRPREPMPTGGFDLTFGRIIPNVIEGQYDVNLFIEAGSGPPSEYFADIRQNGQSVLDSGVTVTQQQPAPIEIVFEAGAGTIRGEVRGRNGEGTFYVNVQLLPVAPGPRRRHFSKLVESGPDGSFVFTNVTPGEYLLFASNGRLWDAEDELAFREVRRQVGTITVGRGETTTAPAPMISSWIEPPR